jgi:protein-tyrosine phosphatase
MFDSILVVCLGNICRSPIGEALFKQKFPGKKIASAGIYAMVGAPADLSSIRVMKDKEGLDLEGHKARQLTEAMISEFELILVMDQEQKKHLESKYPFAHGKILLFDSVIEHREIPDPYKLPMHAFEHAYQLMREGVNVWATQLN